MRWFSKAFKLFQKSSRNIVSDFFSFSGGSIEKSSPTAVSFDQMRKMYQQDPTIRACVDITKRVVCSTDWVIKPRDESRGAEQGHIDQVKAFFHNPNDREESFQEILSKVIQDLLILDAGVFEITHDVQGMPAEIYALDGAKVKLTVDEHGEFKDTAKAYELKVGGKTETFAQNEIIYLMLNPQSDSVYGLSPLESLYKRVIANIYTAEWQKNFFKNSAVPQLLLSLKGGTHEQMQKFQRFLENEFKGFEKAHKTLVMNLPVDVTKLSYSNEEMEFMDYQKFLRRTMCAVYSVPEAIIGEFENANRANSQVQYQIFKNQAVLPICNLISYHFNTALIPQFGFDDVEFRFKPTDVIDKKLQADTLAVYLNNSIMTINEARGVLGLPRVTWGDVPLEKSQALRKGREFVREVDHLKRRIEEILEERGNGSFRTDRKEIEVSLTE